MANTRAISGLSREFQAFLYASIGEDSSVSGVQLSVLSALARLDIDPWAEAARLAALPKCEAARQLARVIATLPSASVRDRDPKTLATRLVDLLPDHRSTRHYQFPEIILSPKSASLRILFVAGMLVGGLQWFPTGCQPWSERAVSPSLPATPESTPERSDASR